MDVLFRFWFSVFAITALFGFSGCASQSTVSKEATIDSSQEKNIDPWETYNRGAFAFNDTLDRWLLKPVAKGYRYIAPAFVEKGVNNFFANLGEVGGAFNNLLQWKWGKVGNSSGRFVVNTTIGIAGLFDVAQHMGLPRKDSESFGQTLSYWGVGPGPYLILPLFGPSTVTDTLSLPVDWTVSPLAQVDMSVEAYLAVQGLGLVSSRANILDLEELLSGDKYVFIREAYMQRRKYLVNDGNVQSDFGDDESFDEGFDEGFDEAGDEEGDEEDDGEF